MDIAPIKPRGGELLLALAVTALLVGLPCVLTILLRVEGYVQSAVVAIALGTVVSLTISLIAAWVWQRRAHSALTFQDLTLWGWFRRRRFAKLLSHPESFVGRRDGEDLDTSAYAKRLERLVHAIEARDGRIYGHSQRVARHSLATARRLDLSSEELARLRIAALLHDVGKVQIPRAILLRPGALTEAEYAVVKTHAAIGATMVSVMSDPQLTSIVRHHHERIDGGGYPDGLAGERIPLSSRIIAVADTFDAVTSDRPYRSAMSHRQALELLDHEAGSQLDADVVNAFRSQYFGHRLTALLGGLGAGMRHLGQSILGAGGSASVASVAVVAATSAALGTAALQPAPTQSLADPPPAARHGQADAFSQAESPRTFRSTTTPRGPDHQAGEGSRGGSEVGAARNEGGGGEKTGGQQTDATSPVSPADGGTGQSQPHPASPIPSVKPPPLQPLPHLPAAPPTPELGPPEEGVGGIVEGVTESLPSIDPSASTKAAQEAIGLSP